MRDYPSDTQRANRRRLTVFVATFVIASAIGLGWTFSRPPQYLASARAQINPGSVQVESVVQTGAALGTDAPRSLLTEIQVLTSRPIVEETLSQLPSALREVADALGADPVDKLQQSLEASPAEGSSVVRVQATGGDPALVAALVNGVIATYTHRLEAAYQRGATRAVALASEEVANLEAKVAAKRREVEAFRQRHDIVSVESQENEASIRQRALANSVVAASEKAAVAEGKYRAVEESVAAGKTVGGTAEIENLERQAAQIRADLDNLRRRYTENYLELDPNARAQKQRLAELERQIEQKRSAARSASSAQGQAALAAAREEAVAARDTAVRLQQQLATNRASVQQFAARLNEYRALRDELAPLETLLRDAIQRKARLDAGERGRRPSVEIVEAARVPAEVWRPLYARDAAIAVAAAFALALIAMWLVEHFNRSEPAPTMLVPQPVDLGGIALAPAGRAALPGQPAGRLAYGGQDAQPADAGGLLAGPGAVPRELTRDEVASLLEAAEGGPRAAALLLLSGVSPEELVALRREDLDLERGTVRVAGAAARTLELPGAVADALRASGAFDGGAMFGDAGGRPLDAQALSSALVFAAHDARLPLPLEVTPDALRHTYLVHLVRQGIRMADLARIAGAIAPPLASVYVAEAPAGKPLPLGEVDRVPPGVSVSAAG